MFAKAPEVRRPIASLTKVMTALLVLQRRALDDVVTVSPDAVFDARRLRRIVDARAAGGGAAHGPRAPRRPDAAIGERRRRRARDRRRRLRATLRRADERRARALGMRDTEFFSPNGLDDRGRSTARDLLVLTRAAYASRGFGSIVASKVPDDPRTRRASPRRIQNRNAMLWLYPGADRREDRVHGRGRVLPDRHRRARRSPARRDRARRSERGRSPRRPRCSITASRGIRERDVRRAPGRRSAYGRDPGGQRCRSRRSGRSRRSCPRAQLEQRAGAGGRRADARSSRRRRGSGWARSRSRSPA